MLEKTPRSVSLQGVKLRAVFTSAESDSTQCYLRGVWLHAVLAWAKSISSIFSKNLNVVLSFSEIFIFYSFTPHSVSLRTYSAKKIFLEEKKTF